MQISIQDGVSFYREIFDKDLRLHLKYLSQSSWHTSLETNVVARRNGEVIGAVGLWPNPHDEQVLWMPFLTVRPDHKHQGVGTALALATAEFAKQQGKILKVSRYSDEGKLYLKRVFDRLRLQGYKIQEDKS